MTYKLKIIKYKHLNLIKLPNSSRKLQMNLILKIPYGYNNSISISVINRIILLNKLLLLNLQDK